MARKTKEISYDIEALDSYDTVNSLYHSRYYSRNYWAAKLALNPDDEEALLQMHKREAEVEELRQLRRKLRPARHAPAPRPPPAPPRARNPPAPRQRKPKKEVEVWVPQPLCWD